MTAFGFDWSSENLSIHLYPSIHLSFYSRLSKNSIFSDIVNRVLNDPEVSADTKITISFIEIYNEKIADLLLPASSDGCELKVRERPGQGAYIENLSKVIFFLFTYEISMF